MISHITADFRKAFESLPLSVQKQARESYKLFQQDPHHPGLQFKRVHPRKSVYSVRVSRNYRALDVREEDVVVWFWIGSHADYDKLISQL